MVIACRTTPNDKKKKGIHTERYRSLDSTKLRARSVARGRFLRWPHSGTHCTTPGGINSLPLSVDPTLGSKMNCHCYFNRGEGGKEKRDVDGHFDGASFVARKLEEWYKEGYIIVFRRFVFRVFRAVRYLRCLRVWIVESFTMLQIIRNKIWYVLHTWQPPGVYLLISRDWWFGWRDVV